MRSITSFAGGPANGGFHHHIGGAAHQQQMLHFIAPHQNEATALVHGDTIEHGQTVPGAGDAAATAATAKPAHQEHGEAEQRCDYHQGDRYSSRKLKLLYRHYTPAQFAECRDDPPACYLADWYAGQLAAQASDAAPGTFFRRDGC